MPLRNYSLNHSLTLIASDWKKSMYSGILTSQPAQDISPPLFFHCLREVFARIDCCIYWNKACYILELFHSIFIILTKYITILWKNVDTMLPRTSIPYYINFSRILLTFFLLVFLVQCLPHTSQNLRLSKDFSSIAVHKWCHTILKCKSFPLCRTVLTAPIKVSQNADPPSQKEFCIVNLSANCNTP